MLFDPICRPTEHIVNRVLVLGVSCFALLLWTTRVCAPSKPAGTAVPENSPVFAAFKTLQQTPAYRMTFEMNINDPRMALAAAHGFGFAPMESIVKGGVHQATTHMTMPAFDKPVTVDDWEIRAVVKDGRGARMTSQPAIPRLRKLNDEMPAMPLAMMAKQAAMTVARPG